MDMSTATEKLINTIFSCSLKGKVVAIVGSAGVGKTAFTCMQLPLYYIMKFKKDKAADGVNKAIIVVTDNSFLTDRFSQVLKAHSVKYSDVRDCIEISNVTSFTRQEEKIKEIAKKVMDDKGSVGYYIAIDPFNHHLRMEFAKANEQYRLNVVGKLSPRLEYQMNILSTVAVETNSAVVLTLFPKRRYADSVPQNWHSGYFGPLEVAHLSDIVLWMTNSSKGRGYVDIHVVKHRLKEAGEVFTCKIKDGGLVLV